MTGTARVCRGWVRRAAPAVLAALVLVGLAGCDTTRGPAAKKAAAAAAAAASAAGAVPLGQNAVHEDCRLQPRPAGVIRDVFCGSSQRPGATIYVEPVSTNLPEDEAARRGALERLIKVSAATADIQTRVACQPGSWQPPADDLEVYLATCQLKAGNWPYLTMGAAVGDQLVIAEGIPASVPVILAAMRVAGGKPAEAKDGGELAKAVLTKLEATLGTDKALFGAGEINAYQDQSELARLSNSVENYAAAEAAWRHALDVQTRLLGNDDPGLGETLMNLALEVSNQGRFAEADALFRRAEPLVQKSVDSTAYPRFLSYLAIHAANQRDYARALSITQDVIARRRSLASELGGGGNAPGIFGAGLSNQGEIAHSLMLEAAMAARVNKFADADAAAREARQLVSDVGGLPAWWKPAIEAVSADVAQREGKMGAAEAAYKLALDQRRALFGRTWPVATALMDLGRFYSQTDNTEKALATYREAFQIADADGKHPDITFDMIAPFLTAAAAQAGRLTGDARTQLYDEMFRVSQFVRDSVAGQTIARSAARLASDDPKVGDLVRNLQEASRDRDTLRLELAAETAKADDERDKAREQALRDKLTAAASRTTDLEAQIQSAYPNYAKLTTPKPVEAKAIEQALAPGEAMVVFQFGRDVGLVFLVRADGITAAPLPVADDDVAEQVGELRKAFVAHGARVDPFNLQLSYELYKKLFGPIEPALAGITHLIVVPAGALSSFPPALFVTAPPPGGEPNYSAAAWLIKKMATSIEPSVRAFVDLRALARRPSATKSFIGFGNPAFEGPHDTGKPGGGEAPSALEALSQECRVGQPLPTALLRALNPLPETADEVRKVAALLHAGPEGVVLGRDVNEVTIKARDLSQYRVIYFATHGLLPGELRCQSEPGLALSPPETPPTSTENDGLLSSSKIAALRLNADLVVLSACNTGGSGGKFGGGALSGLAESFFYAGARSMLVTHWQVPSVPTVRLTTSLFERLTSAGGTAQALQQSQLNLLNNPETAHPFFWAAFTLVGESGGVAAARTPEQAAGSSS